MSDIIVRPVKVCQGCGTYEGHSHLPGCWKETRAEYKARVPAPPVAMSTPTEPVADVPSGDTVLPELPKPISKSKHWDAGIEWAVAGERARRMEREDQLRDYKAKYEAAELMLGVRTIEIQNAEKENDAVIEESAKWKARCEAAERKVARLEEILRQSEDLRAAGRTDIPPVYIPCNEIKDKMFPGMRDAQGRKLAEARKVLTPDMRDTHGRTQAEAQGGAKPDGVDFRKPKP